MQSIPIYLDWQFWAAIVAVLALVLSQLPPVFLWFLPRKLEVEIHSRVLVSHKVGNANISSFVSVRNTGGRVLRIRGMNVTLSRDGNVVTSLPAQNYFETSSSKAAVLFVPFSLKPGEQWAHGTNFLQFFDRATEKLFRESASALLTDIRQKIASKPEQEKGKEMVVAEAALIQPFISLFEQKFLWIPGEYVMELSVNVAPGSASFVKKYRFTLFESDAAELRSHSEDYKFGGGISYDVDRHVGLTIPLVPHEG